MTIIFNGDPRPARDNLTVAELLAELDLESRRVAVEVNQELAPRARHSELVLREGDRVEVVTLVGGG